MDTDRLRLRPAGLVASLAVLASWHPSEVRAQAPAPAQQAGDCQATPASGDCQPMEEVTVTAPRRELLGTASTASEGVVEDQEIQLTPDYRPGQILETVPGLIVTLHSGEGKANQFLMRGYNLDHGTDLETYVDDMPINQPTHAHGQGYTDLNFLIPELADAITYTKGPYYANVGDFGAVGSVRVNYRDTIPDQASATVGSFGFGRLFTAASQPLGQGHLLEAVEVQHYDGPFVVPDDARKENAVLRYSDDGQDSGFSLTGMFYHQVWTNTTDIPFRAISQVGYFGSLDPSDGGHAMRASLSAQYHAHLGGGQFSASAFYIYNQLNLFNDFTQYLFDPVHGDQEDQFETRHVIGSAADYTLPATVGAFDNEVLMGASTRYDILDVGRLPSQGQVPLSAAETAGDPASFSNHDDVNLFAGALYMQATTHWSSTVRSVLGVRNDYQHGTDDDLLATLHETAGYTNGGAKGQSLLQPKGSLIYTPRDDLEFYLSAGEGFHSADLRGVNQAGNPALDLPSTPLLAKQWGEEVGVRTGLRQNFTLTLALYNLWQQSETIIDPDVGMDTAGPPSERYGFEVNATYAINKYLEFYGSLSGNHARFTEPFDDGTGHLGTYITDAPAFTGSLALYLHDLGPWSGGLEYRYLGNYPLSSGPCVNAAAVHDFPGVATSCTNAPTAPGQVNGKGFGQLNLDVHYALPQGWTASLGVYNLLNTHAPAAEFWYVDRLQSEIATDPDGRADIHEHPLEPLMARFTIAKQF
jgi:outer membrane receptor protein involved in Fe transport